MSDMYPNYVIELMSPPMVVALVPTRYAVQAFNERRAVELAVEKLIEKLRVYGPIWDTWFVEDDHLWANRYRVVMKPTASGRGTHAPG